MNPPDSRAQQAPSQWRLLRQSRFGPLFWTQFAGAANDNLIKFAVTLLVTYQIHVRWLPASSAGAIIGALFITPFLVLSATAGQWADGMDKAILMRRVKTLEVGIAVLAAIGFLLQSPAVLLGAVLLLGLHSTLFGPVKYAYLPQHLRDDELTGGNGLIEMGTFVAIVVGNVAGGLLMNMGPRGGTLVGGLAIVLAILGRMLSSGIPATPPSGRVAMRWAPIRDTREVLRQARTQLALWRSLFGISWMWFVGAVLLGVFPSLAHDVIRGDPTVASVLLTAFALGMAAGSMSCERLSRHTVEIGLVPVGALLITCSGLWLAHALDAVAYAQRISDMAPGSESWSAFLQNPTSWPVLAALFALAASMGLFSVPMYALLQLRAAPAERARIIAANNVMNAVFMIASAAWTAGVLHLADGDLIALVRWTAWANLAVATYILMVVPEYVLRLVAYLLSNLGYRLKLTGERQIPTTGAALLIANHVTFIDAVLLLGSSPRPIRFLMDAGIFKHPILGPLFRLGGAIPVSSRTEDPEAYAKAFARVEALLADGELVAIFPEGQITKTGHLNPFRPGLLKILATSPVPVIPCGLSNLWGSYFSRVEQGRAMVRPFRRGLWSRVRLRVGAPLGPAETLDTYTEAVEALLEPNERRAPAPPAGAVSCGAVGGGNGSA